LPLHVLLVCKVLAGFCAGAVNPIIGVVMLERIPSGLRARVLGLVNAGCWAAMPIGSLVAGFGIDRVGLTGTLVGVGSVYVLTTLRPALGGPWRTMDRPMHEEPVIDEPAPAGGSRG
jgi:MFS family permease